MEYIPKAYMDNLEGMGYPEWWREKVLLQAAIRYSKVMQLVKAKKTSRNRLGKETEIFRLWKKTFGPSSWFKEKRRSSKEEGGSCPGPREYQGKNSKKDKITPEGVMFIQTTPGSSLKTQLQAMDLQMGFKNKWKYVEVGGATVLSKLFSPDPSKLPCGGPLCKICPTEPGKCATKSVIYRYEYMICQETHEPYSYIGETARTAFERTREHEKLISSKSTSS